jgi:hypothetical protein
MRLFNALRAHGRGAQKILKRSSQPEQRKSRGQQENEREDVARSFESDAGSRDHRNQQQSPRTVLARKNQRAAAFETCSIEGGVVGRVRRCGKVWKMVNVGGIHD